MYESFIKYDLPRRIFVKCYHDSEGKAGHVANDVLCASCKKWQEVYHRQHDALVDKSD